MVSFDQFTKFAISFVLFTEVSTKFRNRPEKRTGGGGYGQLKAMNSTEKKNKVYKTAANMKKAHHMQYARWISMRWITNEGIVDMINIMYPW